MNVFVRAMSGAAVGVFLGVCVVVIASVATAAISHFTQTLQRIPYIFQSAFAEAGNQTQLHLTPNYPGMLAVIALFGVAVMLYFMFNRGGQRRRSGSGR